MVLAMTAGGPAEADEAAPASSLVSYRFGVFPYLPALTIDRLFGAMAARFADVLDAPVYLKTKSTFELFEKELENETYDLVFVHPFFYVAAADRHHYRPLVRLEGKLTAVVMAPGNRPWRGWRDLAGRTLALPPALSAVSEMAKASLLAVGLDPGRDVDLQHYRTKVSCLQAVVIGSADACAVPRFVLHQITALGEMDLRVVAETPPINHLVLAVHERVPARDRARLLDDIRAWPDTGPGRQVLAAGSWPGFVPAKDGDYDQVRRYRTRLQRLAHR